MSSMATKSVLQRAMKDEAFLARFRESPEEVLARYDLEEDERKALLGNDEKKLREVLGEAAAKIIVVVVVDS